MRAWLELFRISNLPTVWTNVLVGMCIPLTMAYGVDPALPMITMIITLVAVSCLYTSGMILNDVFDVAIDRLERPSRPIPSDRITRTTAGLAGSLLLLLGVGLPWLISFSAGVSAVMIGVMLLLYDRFHASTAWSVLLLGGCRCGLYMLGCESIVSNDISNQLGWKSGELLAFAFFLSIPVVIHVVSFSLIARSEVAPVPVNACPRCRYPVPSEATICPECGSKCDRDATHAARDARTTQKHLLFGTGTFTLLAPFALFLVPTILWGSPPTQTLKGLAGFIVFNAIAVLGLGFYLIGSIRHLTSHPEAVGRFVLRSIGALCLYDTAIASIFWIRYGGNAGIILLVTLGCFFLVRWSHRRIAGT
ncbi:MAG: UbiA family prenyltransferase [Phycisphaerales bacterium]|nr:UbiA family prenyltransferase [Phycisphaerales bacterium]